MNNLEWGLFAIREKGKRDIMLGLHEWFANLAFNMDAYNQYLEEWTDGFIAQYKASTGETVAEKIDWTKRHIYYAEAMDEVFCTKYFQNRFLFELGADYPTEWMYDFFIRLSCNNGSIIHCVGVLNSYGGQMEGHFYGSLFSVFGDGRLAALDVMAMPEWLQDKRYIDFIVMRIIGSAENMKVFLNYKKWALREDLVQYFLVFNEKMGVDLKKICRMPYGVERSLAATRLKLSVFE